MAVTLNPLKSPQIITAKSHENDVIPTNDFTVPENDGFYNFPTGVEPSLDIFLLALNCTWYSNGTECVSNFTNGTGRATPAEGEAFSEFILMGITSVVLGLMILITIIGNVFVIAAILLQRNLQNVANYLIVSLAVADLMVACLVMPFGAIYEISKGWSLGPEYCDMWTSSDVLCCTASILHLVAIATDRYWAVTNVDYIHTRNANRICGMIIVIWSVALIVSLAPQFGWKDDQYLHRIEKERRCLPSQDIGYQIFATCSTFYVPLLVILILYWKIFQTARKRIHRRQRAHAPKSKLRKQPEETAFTISKMSNSPEISVDTHPLSTTLPSTVPPSQPVLTRERTKKESLEAKRERKAAKTLAIITGAFVVCWLPFFVMALVMPLCDSCVINDYVASFFLWLGYFNSTLNPVIYTIFSPEFRQAFTRILCGVSYSRKFGKVR